MYGRAVGVARISGLTGLGSVSWPRVAPGLCRRQRRALSSESTQVKVSHQLIFKHFNYSLSSNQQRVTGSVR